MRAKEGNLMMKMIEKMKIYYNNCRSIDKNHFGEFEKFGVGRNVNQRGGEEKKEIEGFDGF